MFLSMTLLACVEPKPADAADDTSSQGDTQAGETADTADTADTGAPDTATMRANVEANLDCGLVPTMALDQETFPEVYTRGIGYPSSWLLTDLNIQNFAGIFASQFPDQTCLTLTGTGFSGSCVDVEGWTVSGTFASWSTDDPVVYGGAWTDLALAEPYPYGDWELSGFGSWETAWIDGAEHYDVDRHWTSRAVRWGGVDDGEFSLVASGDLYTPDGVFAGEFSALGDPTLPDGTVCFAEAYVQSDANWVGWEAVMGDHLWEQETAVGTDGAACTRVYEDGALVDDGCG